jgi:hypothetical protein
MFVIMRFEILKAVRMSVLLFWVLTLCRFAGRYQRFGETLYSSSMKTQKNDVIFVIVWCSKRPRFGNWIYFRLQAKRYGIPAQVGPVGNANLSNSINDLPLQNFIQSEDKITLRFLK